MTPKNLHLGNIAQICRAVSSQLRHVSTTGKKTVLKSNISSTCPRNMGNVGPLTAEIGSGVWGTPANFNGFRILPSLGLLQRRRSPEAIQTLHNVWPSPGLVLIHYTHFQGLMTEFCPVQNSVYVQVLHSPILTALLHSTPAAGVSQTLRRGTRNYGTFTELSQRSPPIFGWAVMTLGTVPHSSRFSFRWH